LTGHALTVAGIFDCFDRWRTSSAEPGQRGFRIMPREKSAVASDSTQTSNGSANLLICIKELPINSAKLVLLQGSAL
jgi:hypothetical protein